ncbi:MAG: hypothetical protein IPM74_01265 [Crocinitomicaceae bacterium]|nr:hypothetical protein [Crocinitomicaceae bacterium]MBK8924546.1 hypothetical protein [Crocinitomicaceae bacterium]
MIRFRTFIVALLSTSTFWSCQEKEVFIGNSSTVFIPYANQTFRDLTISYFDSSNIIQFITVHDRTEMIIIEFYRSQNIKSLANGKYIDNEIEFGEIQPNTYNYFLIRNGEGTSYSSTQTLYNTFYESGKPKNILVRDLKDNFKFSYNVYHENGNIKTEMKFQHVSLDSLFVPVGIWKEYSLEGILQKEFHAPASYEFQD